MIATGFATGTTADPAIAAQAVAQAMSRASITHANSVLLFLSDAFARDPQPALLAASRQSQCMQIAGCSAAGIFTEDDWVLDAPAAAAMVFGGTLSLSTAHSPETDDLVLALTAPNAINRGWINAPGQRFGGVAGDATGHGLYKVWNNGKVNPAGRCELYIQGATSVIGVSHGIRALTAPTTVTTSNGFDVITLGRQSALNLLARELPLEVRELDHIPLHLIMAAEVIGEPEAALAEGRYRLIPVIATNPDDRSVTLAARLAEGSQMFWAMRQPLAAERSMRVALDRTEQILGHRPDFAIVTSSSGRGPSFYGGEDKDLQVITRLYPDMPVIGFYGNGEIGWLNNANQLLEYSTVFGLFHHDV
ncbi:FIST C-terminal domain-containing protein [Sulfuriferula thiophila]|uniref:FIST C-terminal domain-containing protein n=1 Tax=Sulfuriferula thiophila TaxID=1781211 RepID=UPI000F60D249|nr:FIST C-terminal domain-containing protein [Sulfuriferula thiophila]